MNSQLVYLISLQEIDMLIKDKKREEKAGYKMEDIEEFNKARESILSHIEPHLLRKYQRLKERYGNAVVPVVAGICQGCFMLLPTSLVSQKGKNERIHTCPNCGRILFWADE